MNPLNIDVSQFGTSEELTENISHALSLGLPELQPSICSHDGTWVVVGSGPSVDQFVDEIREESKIRSICAVKGSYDWCVENGITPAFYLSVEPRIRKIKHPQKESIYLLASRVDPEMFEHLKDYEVVLWHSWSVDYENKMFEGRLAIGGGTTSGLRAISIGYILGFRNFHLYGFDSCLVNGEKRLGQGKIHDEVKTIDVRVGDRTFICNMGMAQQADDFQGLYEFLPGIHIKSFGDGLITSILEERERQGMLV